MCQLGNNILSYLGIETLKLTMEMENDEEFLKWKKERRSFLLIAITAMILYGLELITTSLSIVFYLKDRYHFNNKEVALYYSFAQAGVAAVQMFSGLILGRYADRTRNAKGCLLLVLTTCSMSNLIYTLPLPIWIILVARCLLGIQESLQSAVLGK